MKLPRLAGSAMPPLVKSAATGHGRVLAWAPLVSGATVVATVGECLEVTSQGPQPQARGWHEVVSGSWDPDASSLTVRWVDHQRSVWQLAPDASFLQVFRERVQASTLTQDVVDLGPGESARVAIRRNLTTGELVEQIVADPGSTLTPQLRAACEQDVRRLAEQVGVD